MIHTTDQLGDSLQLPCTPRRIISLVPSQTELLFDLGAGESVVGVTRYCIHPAHGVSVLPVIGGTKRFHFDRIAALQPDLVIGNREENYRSGIDQLRASYPVWMSDVNDLPSALEMITEVGRIVDCQDAAAQLCVRIGDGFGGLASPTSLGNAAYFIWREPWMVAASETFIDDMLHRAGLENAFGDLRRYPEISLDELVRRQPDWVLLSSEPYDFGQSHVEEFQALLPAAKVIRVDGTYFSWYGSRLAAAVDYLRNMRCAGVAGEPLG